ncbi:MAG: 23S rRNA (pseudouridine(1915)-N(3))-methyltransferase RlmH [Bacilli bacterium]|nr:23S rRNA (pseudouridine(1915)-N(3))-methyltransferase RlmH [Bacilli bacterium]MBN2697000.1 23S rRNA (pseudouridine(1915)-N(3))-methyltransferase RlmH [Bacilli bacterium]
MNITIIAVGSLKEKYLTEGVNEYMKRLDAFANVEIIEIEEEPSKTSVTVGDIARILEREGQRITDKIKPGSYVVALDIEGDHISSEGFAKMLGDIGSYQSSNIIFIIGGSWGLSDFVKSKAAKRLSFSKMTFPHQLMRLVFVEQLYRAFMISSNRNYHK